MSLGLGLGLPFGRAKMIRFDPLTLFANGEQGAWYDPSDITTLFQDSAGSTPVTAAGQPVGRVVDKSPNGVNALQTTSTARPIYRVSPNRLSLDKVDDALTLTVPTGGFVGTMIISVPAGTAAYGVNIPAGSYTIGGLRYPTDSGVSGGVVGVVIRDGAMNAAEIASVSAYFASKGGGPIGVGAYAGVASLTSYWRDMTRLTSFPLIDASSTTVFSVAWFNCTSLTSFPLLDTSSGTNFDLAWTLCSALTSFPLLNVSAGTSFKQTWQGCSALTSFPLLNVSAGTVFDTTWRDCTSLTSFPLLDVSSGTNFSQAWRGCSSLTSFPLLDVSSGTNFSLAWALCTSLVTFPSNYFDGVLATDFTNAFLSTNLSQTSIDGILVSINSNGTSNGTFNQSGGSAPSATGEAAITAMRSRGWTVTVTGGF